MTIKYLMEVVTMDQNTKTLIESLFDLFKDFIALIGGGEKFDTIVADVKYIFGIE